jgi:hypothetical protein
MIKKPNEPAFDVDLTRAGEPIPIPVSGDAQRPGTRALVHSHPAGDPGADYRLAHFESAAGDCYLVRCDDRPVALLHLHGVGEAALGAVLGDALARDPEPVDRWTLDGGPGRFHQRQERAQGVRLPAQLRPRGQGQSKSVPVGPDAGDGGAAEGDPWALELSALGLRLLSALPDAARAVHPRRRPSAGLSNQVRPSGTDDRGGGQGVRPGPGPGGRRQLVRQRWVAQALAGRAGHTRPSALAPAGQYSALRPAADAHANPGAATQVWGASGQSGTARRHPPGRGAHLHTQAVWRGARGRRRRARSHAQDAALSSPRGVGVPQVPVGCLGDHRPDPLGRTDHRILWGALENRD